MNTQIYTMKLHDYIRVDENLGVLRVPGGWIYYIRKTEGEEWDNTFVPFDNEFMKND